MAASTPSAISPIDDLLYNTSSPVEMYELADRISPAEVQVVQDHAPQVFFPSNEGRVRYRSSVAEDMYCEVKSPTPISFHGFDDSTYMEYSFMSEPSPTPPEVLEKMAPSIPRTRSPEVYAEPKKPWSADRPASPEEDDDGSEIPEEDHEGYKRRCVYEKLCEKTVEYIREKEPNIRKRERIKSTTVQRMDEITFKTPEEKMAPGSKTPGTRGVVTPAKVLATGFILLLLAAVVAMQVAHYWLSVDDDRK